MPFQQFADPLVLTTKNAEIETILTLAQLTTWVAAM